jgi:hypothetical protein
MGFNLELACRHNKLYLQGVKSFLAFTFKNSVVDNKSIICLSLCLFFMCGQSEFSTTDISDS